VALGISNEELALKAQRGDKAAKELLVKQNMGLVYMVARRYPMPGVQLDDQVQEGCIGLLECLNTYDPEKGCAFSTHAVQRIKANILRKGNEQAQTIQIPTHIFETRLEINRFVAEFIQDHKKRPTMKQIAYAVNKPLDNIRNLMITDAIGQPGSIDASINVNDDEIKVSDTYGGEWLEDVLIQEQKYDKLLQFVGELPNPERTIIECLYGLNGKPVHTMGMLEGKITNAHGWALSISAITSRQTLALTYLEDRAMGLNIPYEQPKDKRKLSDVKYKDSTKRDIVVVLSNATKQAYITFDQLYSEEEIPTIRNLIAKTGYAYLLDDSAVVLQYTKGVDLASLEAEVTACFNDIVENGYDVIL
jgi:RNA polymerase sigma factor (sigma-70 family)